MTDPPQAGDEHRPDDGADAGASPAQPDRFPTEPVPTIPPGSPPYGQHPPYPGQEPATAPYGASPYAPPGPPIQPYGQAAQQYGSQPYAGQPYGSQPYAGAPYGGQPYGPPQYGAPWGAPGQQFGPPAAPARKSRVGLIAILTGVALLVIAGVVVVATRLQPTVLDAAAAERDVAAQFQQREGVAIDLHCPDNMKVKAGATYVCTGKTADQESVKLRLTITDARTAAYTWAEG